MKKNVFFLLTVLFINSKIEAQTHQIYFGAGYSVPTTTGIIYTNQSIYINDEGQEISTYAEGIIYNGGYQYNVTQNFQLDLNLGYLPGYKDEPFYTDFEGGFFRYTNSKFSVTPTISIKFDVGNISPYTKFGVSFNFIKLEMERKNSGYYSNVTYLYEYKKKFSLGLVGGFGLNLNFDKTISCFLEAQLNSFTHYPDELIITSFFSNGIMVEEKYKLKENASSSNNEIPAQEFPFSSLSFIVGLKLNL